MIQRFRYSVVLASVGLLFSVVFGGPCPAQERGGDSSLEDANKELKGESEKKPKEGDTSLEDANRELKGDDEEEPAAQVNPIEKLVDISKIMREATDFLINAAKRGEDAVRKQNDAENELGKLIPPADEKQSQAMRELDKLMKETEDKQGKSIEELEKLIKLAREMQAQQQQQQQSQSQPKDGQQKPQPQKNEPKDSERSPNPAQKPYQVPPHKPPETPQSPRIADPKEKWGNLPPKLREEIMMKMLDELLPEYEERIMRFYKLLNEME